MQVTIEEAKAMVGTEFTYVYPDGDTIQAYVNKFDPKIGFTCMSLDTYTRNGWTPSRGMTEEDGTFCVLSADFKKHTPHTSLECLAEIRDTGMYVPSSVYAGRPNCAFV
ncbi:MAG: hypothetical protein WC055_00085 [Melioribacteraceae bacterium]